MDKMIRGQAGDIEIKLLINPSNAEANFIQSKKTLSFFFKLSKPCHVGFLSLSTLS